MAHLRGRVPEWLNQTYIENLVRNHFQKPNIKVQKIDIAPGSNEGDNYSCQLLRIKLDFQDDGENKHMSIIGKIKQDSEAIKGEDSTLHLFLIEAAVYDKLFPLIKKGSPVILKNVAPECYHVDYERNTIFLEDLSERQFIMPARGQLLNKEEAILTMETLATLHGASYQAFLMDPTFKETFQEAMFRGTSNKPLEKWFHNAIRGLEKNIDSYGLPVEWCKKLRGVGDRLMKEFFKVCDFQEGDLNLLTHGDLWLNNLMYHYKDGVVDQVLILDYQFATYRSFALDLHFIIYSSMKAEVIISDLDPLLETYYNKLKTVAPEIANLTLDRVKKEFVDKKFFGVAQCVYFRPILHAIEPIDVELIIAGGLEEMGYKNPAYADDLHKLVPHLVETGFL